MVVLGIVAMSIFSSCKKEDFFYNVLYNGEVKKDYLTTVRDKVILKTNSETKAEELSKSDIFLLAYDVAYIWVIATINPKATNLSDLIKMKGVVDAAYGIKDNNGVRYLSDQISVQFKEGQSPENVLQKVGLTKSVISIELIDSFSEIYLITLNVNLGDIPTVCRYLFKSGLCEFAEPSFFREFQPGGVGPH